MDDREEVEFKTALAKYLQLENKLGLGKSNASVILMVKIHITQEENNVLPQQVTT